MIRASITAGVRPTTMILGEDNRKAWSHLDVLAMQAFQIIEDERCGQCGLPRWLCKNDDPRLQVRIKVDSCYAKQELDKFEEERKKGDSGGLAYPEFYTKPDNIPLHEFRALYYEQLAAERAEDEGD
ncbi:hypothetical protein [Streptomyces sp. AC495_CC817]|uniref:hypothetical protein n=1 Tax=Streptomyces sp. AC495_CC817 TaxID=2823900 RepID=UPI001C25EF6C|nr:hypothetical protein [Streptomyces sp. AC495_CC817]